MMIKLDKVLYNLQKVLTPFGAQLVKYPSRDIRRRLKIINLKRIDVILDIGANRGQYAMEMRKLGYKGRIISFEPTTDAFKKLQVNSQKDDNWDVYNFGMGDKNIRTTINLAANSASSSILKMTGQHISTAQHAKYIDKEHIEVRTLDSIYSELFIDTKSILMKVDTQGYEMNVLKGGINSLNKMMLLQLEMSLTPLYDDESLMSEILSFLSKHNFVLFSLENGHYDINSGRLLQVDGIFANP